MASSGNACETAAAAAGFAFLHISRVYVMRLDGRTDCPYFTVGRTRGQWPYRLASYGDKLIISDSKLGLKFEIRGINHTDIYVHEVNVAFNSYFSGL